MNLGVALLGTGRIGGNYIDIIEQTCGAKIRVVAEPRSEFSTPIAEKYPHIEIVPDYKETLNRDDIQLVVATLPHWLHKQAAIDAANAGKHIYLEKPMAVSLTECDEMLAAAKSNDVKLMTAHTQRYMPVVKKMKELVESRQLGDLLMVYDIWHKPYQPNGRPKWMLDRELGGGMGLMDGTHMIDRLLWIIGDDISTVSAQLGAFTHPELPCDDTSMAFFRWKSGVVATICRIAWDTGITDYGADFFFTKGQAKFRIAYGNEEGQKTGFWIGTEGKWKEEPVTDSNSMFDEFSEFIASIINGDDDTPIPQLHGRRVMEIHEACETSALSGREVVLSN